MAERGTVGRLNVEISADGAPARTELKQTEQSFETAAATAEKSGNRITGAMRSTAVGIKRVTERVTQTIGVFTAWASILGLVVAGITALVRALKSSEEATKNADQAFSAFLNRLRGVEENVYVQVYEEQIAALRELEKEYKLTGVQIAIAERAIRQNAERAQRERTEALLEQERKAAAEALRITQELLRPVDSPVAKQIMEINDALNALRAAQSRFLDEGTLRRLDEAIGEAAQALDETIVGALQRGADEAAATIQAPFDFFRQGVDAYAAAVRQQQQTMREERETQARAVEDAINKRLLPILQQIEASISRTVVSADQAAISAQLISLTREARNA